ncbi:hypothetical protein OS493_016356 [Desmophyllum pertusum]|uniref:Serine-threonine/tyrosine-protein kinase catalytic domain-containing protein n=1 Tax=Desmophyllum pertusum TaxID=174260 RepID=A0A9W9ZQ23_9CNID|nr:hypothetical protein OS493_016356 [Desmophyllum pertusum]
MVLYKEWLIAVYTYSVLHISLITGGNPYPGINNKEMYSLLKTGYRMEKPDTCSDKLYQLVLNCWKEDRSERPTFESVTRLLEKMMQEDTPYLDFESLDESKEYYCSEKLSEDDITD